MSEASEEIHVTRALRIYAAATRGCDAPPRVDAAVLDAFRRQRSAPAARPSRRWIWATAAAAALFCAAVLAPQRPLVQPAEPSEEIATAYFPLDDTDPAELETMAVVRMELPRSVLTSFDVPLNPDLAKVPVKADVVVGGDGFAHAVRFLN